MLVSVQGSVQGHETAWLCSSVSSYWRNVLLPPSGTTFLQPRQRGVTNQTTTMWSRQKQTFRLSSYRLLVLLLLLLLLSSSSSASSWLLYDDDEDGDDNSGQFLKVVY